MTKKPLEIHATEMSTIQMKWGHPFVTIWVTGPKGGSRGMMRFDPVEADKLLKALARACAAMEEQLTAAVYADAFRRRMKTKPKRKPKPKEAHH